MSESARIGLGVLLGLGCAAAASGAFAFGRLFVVRRDRGAWRLLVWGHLVMGIVALAVMPWLRLDALPPVGQYLGPLAWTVAWYLVAQCCLFMSLRGMEASRAAPLLGTKVLMLALITVLFLGQRLSFLQWLGVSLVVVGIFVLNDAGTRLGRQRIGGLLVACLFFALSDIGVKRLVTVFEAAGNSLLPGSAFAACLMHAACGLIALALVPWAGSGQRDDWQAAVPYGLCWLTSVVCLFGAFALVGVVLGAMIQATRGLISVLLGAVLARAGLFHLETPVMPHIVLRRTLGAALMIGAITIYLWPVS